MLILLILVRLGSYGSPGETVAAEAKTRVTGYVVDESDSPVRAAKVVLMPRQRMGERAGARLLRGSDISGLTTTTDAEGEFELYVPAEIEQVLLIARSRDHAPLREVLQIQGQDRIELQLRLPAGLEAFGRIVDESGVPIPETAVAARLADESRDYPELAVIAARGTTSSDGRFVLRGLEQGVHTLEVSPPATHAALTVWGVKIDSHRENHIPELVLPASAEIRGRVADAEGGPIDGVEISGATGGTRESLATSDNRGQFELEGFLPGASVVVSATATGYGPLQRVVTAPDSDVILVLSRNGRLRGCVDDAETRNPITEFEVHIVAGSSATTLPIEMVQKTFRSKDGCFEWQDIPAGTWSFSAQAPGYRRTVLDGVGILPGETTEDLNFSLMTEVTLAGRVIDAITGLGLADATVSYQDSTVPETSDWNFRLNMRSVATDAEGNFMLAALWPGKVTIIAQSPGYSEARHEVMAGEESFAEIKLRPGGSISGRVAAEVPNAGTSEAWVELLDVGNQSALAIRSDEAGAFSFRNLKAGRYRIRAETIVSQTAPREIVLGEDERLAGILLVLEEGATILGRVSGLAPSEVRRVKVHAFGPRDFMTSASTNSEGIFRLGGVPAGGLHVTAKTSSGRSISKFIDVPEGIAELTLDIDFVSGNRLFGQVRRGGQPAPAVLVRASPVSVNFASGSATTDQDGMFEIVGLSEADYVISVDGRGSRSAHISGETIMDIELPVSSLSGFVVEADSGEPLPGVSVQVNGLHYVGIAGLSTTTTTDALGRFSKDGVDPGSYQLAAYKSGFKVYTEMVTVSEGDTNLTVSLSRAGGIKIQVRDGIAGFALRSAIIHVLSGEGVMHLQVALDAMGVAEIPQLSHGRYDLRVSSPGYAPKTIVGWTVTADSSLTLQLTPGGSLSIQADRAHTGAKASLVDSGGTPFFAGGTGDPSFTLTQPCVFPNVSPGAYSLHVYLPEGSKRYEVLILEGRPTILYVR